MTEPNASDRKWVREQEKAAKIAERERAEVVVEMMATPQRRKYIWDKLSDAHIFSTTFSTDPIQMSFNEGERNAGIKLLNDIIQHCPEQFIEAMREANGRRTIDNAKRDTGQRPVREDGDGGDQGSAGDSGDDLDRGIEGTDINEGSVQSIQ